MFDSLLIIRLILIGQSPVKVLIGVFMSTSVFDKSMKIIVNSFCRNPMNY